MILHYLKVAVRSLLKYKVQSLISAVGLAAGFVCFALSMIWIRYELTYDNFHRGADRIYMIYGNSILSKNGYSLTQAYPWPKHFARHFPRWRTRLPIFVFGNQWMWKVGNLTKCF